MNSLKSRTAFTLVELLVVIVIIGILASLITVAAMNAVNSARQTKIKFEVDQLDAAMKAVKQQYGNYPPADLTNVASNQSLRSFVAKAFPRYNIANLDTDLQAAGINTAAGGFDPGRALVFWLRGFSPDSTQPFTGTGNRTPFYDFDKTRLRSGEPFVDLNGNGVWETGESFTDTNGNGSYNLEPQYYVCPGDKEAPFVYFDFRSYGVGGDGTTLPSAPKSFTYGTSGTVSAYIQRTAKTITAGPPSPAQAGDVWANLDSFQIISAGQDGVYSSNAWLKFFPRGENYSTDDNDNVSNFSAKSSLEAER